MASRSHLMEKAEEFLQEEVYKEVLDQYNLACKSEQIQVYSLYCEEKYHQFSEEKLFEELEKLVTRLKRERVEKKLMTIRQEIQEAEKAGEKEKLLKLLTEQQEFTQQKNLISDAAYGKN